MPLVLEDVAEDALGGSRRGFLRVGGFAPGVVTRLRSLHGFVQPLFLVICRCLLSTSVPQAGPGSWSAIRRWSGIRRRSSAVPQWVPDAVMRPFLHDEDHVGFLHGGDALGDDDLGGAGNLVRGRPCGSWLVGLGIDGARWSRRESGSSASSAARGRCTGAGCWPPETLVPPCSMYVSYLSGNSLDEVVGAARAGRHGGISSSVAFGVAPAQVLGDGAGEQHVLLQHHGHLVAQDLQVVVAHVHAADLQRAGGHVVQSRTRAAPELRLCGAGAADDADGHAGADLQVDIVEHRLFGVVGVAEGRRGRIRWSRRPLSLTAVVPGWCTVLSSSSTWQIRSRGRLGNDAP